MMKFIIKYIAFVLISTIDTVYTQNQSKLKISRCSSCPNIKKLYDNSINVEKDKESHLKKKDDDEANKNKISYTQMKESYKFILNHKKKKIKYLKEREKCNLR